MANLVGTSNDPNVAAVFGEHTADQAAVIGQSNNGRGVLGISEAGQGVWGNSVSSTGVVGVSKSGHGASGESDTSALGRASTAKARVLVCVGSEQDLDGRFRS
jgi:hypothetical protein